MPDVGYVELSVVIPVHNAAAFIRPCLDSVLSQEVNLEIIGVDVFSEFCLASWNKLYRADFIRRAGIRFRQTPSSDDVFFVVVAFASAERIVPIAKSYYHYRSSLPSSQLGNADRYPMAGLNAVREIVDYFAGHDRVLRRLPDESVVKKIRGLIKEFVPYAIERDYCRRRYGLVNRWDSRKTKGTLKKAARFCFELLPYGFVYRFSKKRYPAPLPTEG